MLTWILFVSQYSSNGTTISRMSNEPNFRLLCNLYEYLFPLYSINQFLFDLLVLHTSNSLWRRTKRATHHNNLKKKCKYWRIICLSKNLFVLCIARLVIRCFVLTNPLKFKFIKFHCQIKIKWTIHFHNKGSAWLYKVELLHP